MPRGSRKDGKDEPPPRPEPWFPSRREQAWDWRLRRVMRYVIGPAVMGWEIIGDGGKNLVVLLVGAMLATSTDVIGVVRSLTQQARAEQKTVEDLLRQDRDRVDRGGESDG